MGNPLGSGDRAADAGGQTGSKVARRQLGARLRELRRQRGVTCAQVAVVIEGSESKVSRLECGRLSFKQRDLDVLLDYYQVDQDQRRQLQSMLLVANASSWWRPAFNDVMPTWFHPYMELEAAARQIRTYEAQVVPGLLQTPGYHRALIETNLLTRNRREVERAVELRLHRQAALAASKARFWAVIDEAALHRTVGDHDVMRTQLQHLRDLAEKAGTSGSHNTCIQVLPFRSGGRAADGSFTILRLSDSGPGVDVPDIIYIEYRTGSVLLDSPKERDSHSEVFDNLATVCPSPEETAQIISEIIENS